MKPKSRAARKLVLLCSNLFWLQIASLNHFRRVGMQVGRYCAGAFREAEPHADFKLRGTGWDLATPAVDFEDVDVQPPSLLILVGLLLYLVSSCCALAWAYERRAGLANDVFSAYNVGGAVKVTMLPLVIDSLLLLLIGTAVASMVVPTHAGPSGRRQQGDAEKVHGWPGDPFGINAEAGGVTSSGGRVSVCCFLILSSFGMELKSLEEDIEAAHPKL
ncbi:hypothetical protein Nepgr_020440 [Nepenthes gracilis]|uniref:Uncharacterized protein n=1 Tax=Nepenthes gracilis TaxID=150966 RepID=A0AAD3XW23_NEPGR|nr:hypothetical protein Nepgr_020440 [Nepenthes gracilis]